MNCDVGGKSPPFFSVVFDARKVLVCEGEFKMDTIYYSPEEEEK